ncbi:radical SAM protein [Pseudaquabacterium pictum]|uniref:radical SAM protein n=1 Tax=Pseudaquabacterium pictum TaxID=2315236 RepID=UPI001396C3B1|nr:radical SAM protein [Rubrivivax pictus]
MAPASEPVQPTRSGFLPGRVVHLHPTLTCNLACAHCYSSSSPQQGPGLDAATWRAALPWLRAQGYDQVSLSGGEPLVHPQLGELVAASQDAGLRVTLISNGLLADGRHGPRHDAVLDRLDGIAISFDGLAPVHNRLRGRSDAFARASDALARQADRGRPVAAAVSVTREALPDLPELAEHLVARGARALQVRPVAAAGRAQQLESNRFCSPVDLQRLYLVMLALQQELAPDVLVQCDLAPAQRLWQQREAYAALLARCADGDAPRRLSDLVNPLVVTETGRLKPIAYDFDSRHDIGSLADAGDALLAAYTAHGLPALRDLVGSALASLQRQPSPLVDWFDLLARRSAAGRIPLLPVAA